MMSCRISFHRILLSLWFLVLSAGALSSPGGAADSADCPNCGMVLKVTRAGGASTTTVDATGSLTFVSSTVIITVGDSVTWTNTASFAHTTTSNTGIWDHALAAGASFTLPFNSVGTFPYHCTIHGFSMSGTIIVNAVVAAPTITSALSATGNVNSAFSYAITASGSPTSFSAVGLPAGLTVDTATGVISGTPTGTGTSLVTIGAANGVGPGTATLSLDVLAALPVISSATTASAEVGQAFSYQIAASNAPTSFSATGLPAGLTVDTGTGLISGTPTAQGLSAVTIGAINAGGTATATLDLTVNPPAPVISSPLTASGSENTAFSYAITATNSPTSFAASGLPTGLAVNTATGLISGTPTVAFSSTVTISATNVSGTTPATVALTISAAVAGAPVITSSTTAAATTGTPFSYAIMATDTPTSFGATGLPAGLSVNTTSGAISGTPTTVGVTDVTISATNGSGTSSTTLAITTAAPVGGAGGTSSPSYGSSGSHCGLGSGAAAVMSGLLLALRLGQFLITRSGRRDHRHG